MKIICIKVRMFEPIVGIKLLQKLKKFDTFYCIKPMLSIWWAQQESNLHDSRQWILSPSCLPISPYAL